MMPSVLIGCPVKKVKSYCIEDYLENISRLTYQNKKFYFVDNSVNFDWHFDTPFYFDIFTAGISVVNHPYICEHRNSSWTLIKDR